MSIRTAVISALISLAVAACGQSGDSADSARSLAPQASAEAGATGRGGPASERGAARVDAARLVAANDEPGQWMATGRTYDEQRFSPLAEITTDNVGELGLAWYGDLGVRRTQESTPLFIDGVLYVTTAWSNVQAFDARTGERLWAFDAEVPGEW